MVDSPAEFRNPYRSPGAAADARGKLGWLVMLVLLWPIVMAAVGSIIGFFVGRLSPDGVDPKAWNPGMGALVGAGVFAVIGLLIGIRKASALRSRLDSIHAKREELRLEMERLSRAGAESEADEDSDSDLSPGGRAP